MFSHRSSRSRIRNGGRRIVTLKSFARTDQHSPKTLHHTTQAGGEYPLYGFQSAEPYRALAGRPNALFYQALRSLVHLLITVELHQSYPLDASRLNMRMRKDAMLVVLCFASAVRSCILATPTEYIIGSLVRSIRHLLQHEKPGKQTNVKQMFIKQIYIY